MHSKEYDHDNYPFSWAFSKSTIGQQLPSIEYLLHHPHSRELSRALYDSYRLAYFPPFSEDKRKQFDKRMSLGANAAISCIYECLVLALLKSGFLNLSGVEVFIGEGSRPDFLLHTLDGCPLLVEVKTLFESDKLRHYEDRCIQYKEILYNALTKKGYRFLDFEILVSLDQIPHKPKEIRKTIKSFEIAIRKANSKGTKAVSVRLPHGGNAHFLIAGSKSGVQQIRKIDKIRDNQHRSNLRLRLDLEQGGKINADYSRRICFSIEKKANQLRESSIKAPGIIAICLADTKLSVRTAYIVTSEFIREQAEGKASRHYNALMLVSFFEPDIDKLYSSIPESVGAPLRDIWSQFPVAKVDAMIVKLQNNCPLPEVGIPIFDASEILHSVPEKHKLLATFFWKQIIFDTRLDPRLVDAKDVSARFVVKNPEGDSILGWSGIEKTLGSLHLSLEDLFRGQDIPGDFKLDDLYVVPTDHPGIEMESPLQLSMARKSLQDEWASRHIKLRHNSTR